MAIGGKLVYWNGASSTKLNQMVAFTGNLLVLHVGDAQEPRLLLGMLKS